MGCELLWYISLVWLLIGTGGGSGSSDAADEPTDGTSAGTGPSRIPIPDAIIWLRTQVKPP